MIQSVHHHQREDSIPSSSTTSLNSSSPSHTQVIASESESGGDCSAIDSNINSNNNKDRDDDSDLNSQGPSKKKRGDLDNQQHEGVLDWSNYSLAYFDDFVLSTIYNSIDDPSLYLLKYTCKRLNQFLQHKKIKQEELCESFAEEGYLKCLKYANKNVWKWDSQSTSSAARNGHLKCLKYLHKNGCHIDGWTSESAAIGGHLEILKYGHENGYKWDLRTTMAAAENNHLECLKYALENGCELDMDQTFSLLVNNGSLDCLKFLNEQGHVDESLTRRLHRSYITKKSVDCLRYLRYQLGYTLPDLGIPF